MATVTSTLLASILLAPTAPGETAVTISTGHRTPDGVIVHDVRSPYQAGTTQIHVLQPDPLTPGRRYPVVFVLPVETGLGQRYGDALKEVRESHLHNTHQAIFVVPTFSHLPWYADHPTRPDVRQESYFVNVVLPYVGRAYPTAAETSTRHLLGFSKSGWGAFTLLLRNPEQFGRAAAFDAPLMMDAPGKYGSGEVFGTHANFDRYAISSLLRSRKEQIRSGKRLCLIGQGNFRAEHERAHHLMDALEIAHEYRDGPTRAHTWHSGWVADAVAFLLAAPAAPAFMPRIKVSPDGKGFVREGVGDPFVSWGFNYDHDRRGRLIEDYWESEWPSVERDFRTMKELGATVVRVHLQFGKFMARPTEANKASIERLARMLRLAEEVGLYLDVTGLGCYHKADVPRWYDELSEPDRWAAQASFWSHVASACRESPAVFCYDLMNEPVVPGGRRKDGDWLGPAFAGKHFVQFVTLDQKGRPRPDIARAWVKHLTEVIRRVDPSRLVTVGLVDWSLDRPGLTSGFIPQRIVDDLDFLAVHIYPASGKLDEALDKLRGFNVGRPVVVEETFPLRCASQDLEQFIDRAGHNSAGWISFYWGKAPEELRISKEMGDAILLDWLTRFRRRAPR